jgi:hypothetical protein
VSSDPEQESKSIADSQLKRENEMVRLITKQGLYSTADLPPVEFEGGNGGSCYGTRISEHS